MADRQIGRASFGESDVASAATCDIGAGTTIKVRITGSVTITSFGTQVKKLRFVRFAGSLLLTHNATSLSLPGGSNYTTAAGDRLITLSDSSGNWIVWSYQAAVGMRLPSFTVSTLPSATPAARMIYVSNGTANQRFAVSDGTNWRFPDGAIVS